MVKVELVSNNKKDKENNKISFVISGVDISYANTLRRLVMSEVPSMAIEDVEFVKNDSGLYDEIVAHRLGLVALKTDLKSYNLPAECKCKGEGCARCQLKMTLKAKGPCTVYASDIKTKDPKVKPVYPKTPIVKLLEGQEIELEATAVLGIGKVHSKWSPCLAFYRELVDIQVKEQPTNSDDVAEQCPAKIFQVKDDKLTVNKDKVQDCTLCDACVQLSKGKVKVEPRKEFLMTLESWGGLEPKEIVETAVETFDSQLEELNTLLGKI